MNKENRKTAKERRAKEREHEAKVAHYKKIWSWATGSDCRCDRRPYHRQRTRFQTTLCQKCLGGYLHSLIGRIRLISLHFGFCLFADRHFPHH